MKKGVASSMHKNIYATLPAFVTLIDVLPAVAAHARCSWHLGTASWTLKCLRADLHAKRTIKEDNAAAL